MQVPVDEAIKKIKRGGRIFIGSGGASPQTLVEALINNAKHFSDNEIVHLLTLGNAKYTTREYTNHFRHNAFFIGKNVRPGIKEGLIDYTPIFLSEIPALFRKGGMPIEAALVMVSPPDRFGYCSLGINVDIVKEAASQARILIAEINSAMPVTYGNSYIHISDIDYYIKTDVPLLEQILSEPDEISDRIGRNVARLIDDGCTLQMGIGIIPNAVLKYIVEKKDLGIHTEMFSDGIVDLYERGTITNTNKGYHDGKIISSFCLGSKRLYQFVDKNPVVEFYPSDYVNNPVNIARNRKMVAINSALEVDLTGQVCADSIGSSFYSGIGGQVDFVRGAAMSPGGKPIIALPSTAKKGTISRIVHQLSQGAGVVTTRGDVHYIVTEYGIAYLHGKSIRQRALELVQISHPDFRNELLDLLKERRYVFIDQKGIDHGIDGVSDRYDSTLELHNKEKIIFRTIQPSDERLVQDFFYSHTEETIYNRYFHVKTSMHHSAAQELVSVNYSTDMALIGFSGSFENQKVVAIGRFMLNPTTNIAEVAFVIHEKYQGKGIASHLLTYLIEIGRERHIQKFIAHILTTNSAMLHIFEKIAPQIIKKIDGSVIEISFLISTVPQSVCFTSL